MKNHNSGVPAKDFGAADFVVTFAALWLLGGCGGPHDTATGQQSVLATQRVHGYRDLTNEEVRDRLAAANVSPSRLYDGIIELSMDARSNPVVCRVLKSLWEGEQPADFDPKYLSVPMVRMGLASILHQCADEADDPQYYDYVMSILEQSPDESDRMRALIGLGVLGSDDDIERLRSYAATDLFSSLIFILQKPFKADGSTRSGTFDRW